MRLQVFLSHNGVCSRRDAMDIIKAGRVKINGQKNMEPSTNVTGQEEITVDGQMIESKDYTYIMLHKPAGYTTTKDDPYAIKTVMELLPTSMRHLSPVGRLDRDTEGLLLFTNDGTWSLALTHPKFHLNKTYVARLKGQLSQESKKKLELGIIMDGRKTAPCQIKDVRYNTGVTELLITIYEGRKRQVRTMFYLVGYKVLYLKRVAVGKLGLDRLELGKWRALTPVEVKSLTV